MNAYESYLEALPPDRRKMAQEWIQSRPEAVRKVMERFPPGTVFEIDGETWYGIGADESGALIISAFNPGLHYETAILVNRKVCPDCLKSFADHSHIHN